MQAKMADGNQSSSLNGDLEFVKTFLKIQEDNFKSFVNLMIDNFTNRFDNLTREVQGIKDSLEFTQRDVDDAKGKLTKVTALEEEMTSFN